MAEGSSPAKVVATFKPREETYQLVSIPGGWIKLRRLSYGARLQRLQLGSSLKTSIKPGGRGKDDEIPAEIVSALKETVYLDLKNCVVDHNLTDSNGRDLNFSSPFDVDALDPAVGEEISALIDRHNSEMGEAEQGNS